MHRDGQASPIYDADIPRIIQVFNVREINMADQDEQQAPRHTFSRAFFVTTLRPHYDELWCITSRDTEPQCI